MIWVIIVLWKGLINAIKFAVVSLLLILGIGGILTIIGAVTYTIA